jgi:hypothetical protein
MGIINLKEARRRTKLNLLPDKDLPYWDPITGPGTARNGQRKMEQRNPRHRQIREAAINYFLRRGFDVYPRGVTVNGTGTCPDSAIFRGGRIIFVECLNEHRVYQDFVNKKRRIEEYPPIMFIVERKPPEEFRLPHQRISYQKRISRVASRNTVYSYDPSTDKIKPYRKR